MDFRTADAADFLPRETNGLSLWGNIASGDHSTGSGLTQFGKTGKTDALLSVIMRKRGNIYQSDGERAPNKEKPAALFAKGSVGITDSNKAGASLRLYRNNTTERAIPLRHMVTAACVTEKQYKMTYSSGTSTLLWITASSM